MTAVDHAAEAMGCVKYAHSPSAGSPFVEAKFVMAQAQVHATLAVAEQTAALVTQQRIRNNIHAASVYGSNPALWPSEIREALGLS